MVGCEHLFDKHDAVFSSGVLMVVPPAEIEDAMNSMKASAGRLVIIREYTALGTESAYQFAHDDERLVAPWYIVHRDVTDERNGERAELIAFAPPAVDAAVGESNPARSG